MQSKRKSKAEPIRPPKTEAKAQTDEDQLAERQRRLNDAMTRAACLREGLEHLGVKFHELQAWPLMGLVEILLDGRRNGIGTSWLANFVDEILVEVAGEGLASVTGDPDGALERLNKHIADFESDLGDARSMVDSYNHYLPMRAEAEPPAAA